jgi:hypothetical protein
MYVQNKMYNYNVLKKKSCVSVTVGIRFLTKFPVGATILVQHVAEVQHYIHLRIIFIINGKASFSRLPVPSSQPSSPTIKTLRIC